MPSIMFMQRLAKTITNWLRRVDPRLLLAANLLLGWLIWNLPLVWLVGPLLLALLLLVAGWQLLPWFRKFLKIYLLFALFWLLCSAIFLSFTSQVLILALRFACLPGLALPLLLTSSPVQLGQVCAWYCSGLCGLWLGLVAWLVPAKRGQLVNPGWKAGLAVALTVSFLPRIYRDLRALQNSLALRAPELKALDKARLLCLAALRLFGAQTWEQSLTICGRGLDQPAVWIFRR